MRSKNYSNEIKYAFNPYVYGNLSVLPKDAGSGIFAINEANVLNGNKIEISNSVLNKGGIIGDWSNYNIYVWDTIDIIADTISLAHCGKIKLI
ncbi:MAG: hypothetical protein LBL57_06620 [Tannerella sp.]|nr:hypothetical protein [Tannerella sp.]